MIEFLLFQELIKCFGSFAFHSTPYTPSLVQGLSRHCPVQSYEYLSRSATDCPHITTLRSRKLKRRAEWNYAIATSLDVFDAKLPHLSVFEKLHLQLLLLGNVPPPRLNENDPTKTPPSPPQKTNSTNLSCRIFIILSILVVINILLLLSLALISTTYPKFSSPGILAFTFGLRHAVDADHIAAIDNVSRKLISDGQQPLLVGFYFSIGHSTVVTLLCAGVAFGSKWLRTHLDNVKSIGAIVGK